MHRLLLLAALCAATAAHARAFTAEVTHVTDGDTLWVQPARGAPRQLRIRGIDAPEICQAHGGAAQQALAARVLHRSVTVTVAGKDDYQRWLASVRLGRLDVGGWLVGQGHAWAHRFKRKAVPYAQLEASARAARRGLWAQPAPVDPREFRRLHGSCH